MGKKRLKYIEKLNSLQQDILDTVVDKIIAWDLDWLDIKPLKWSFNNRRCRIWKLKIVFKKKRWFLRDNRYLTKMRYIQINPLYLSDSISLSFE